MPSGAKILITGPTGQVGEPVALALAADNDVWGLARFGEPNARRRLEEFGGHTLAVDLLKADFGEMPEYFDYVLHFAVIKSWNDRGFNRDLSANVEGLGLL